MRIRFPHSDSNFTDTRQLTISHNSLFYFTHTIYILLLVTWRWRRLQRRCAVMTLFGICLVARLRGLQQCVRVANFRFWIIPYGQLFCRGLSSSHIYILLALSLYILEVKHTVVANYTTHCWYIYSEHHTVTHQRTPAGNHVLYPVEVQTWAQPPTVSPTADRGPSTDFAGPMWVYEGLRGPVWGVRPYRLLLATPSYWWYPS